MNASDWMLVNDGPQTMTFHVDGHPDVILHPDGTVSFNGEPSEAASTFWQAVRATATVYGFEIARREPLPESAGASTLAVGLQQISSGPDAVCATPGPAEHSVRSERR